MSGDKLTKLLWNFSPYFLLSLVHLIDKLSSTNLLGFDTKALLMPLLALGLLLSIRKVTSAWFSLALLAILFSWIGDVALNFADGTLGISSSSWFIIGLLGFLIAHLFYLLIFILLIKTRKPPLWVFVYLLWWLILLWVLLPHLGGMLIPVAIYGAVLGLMAAFGARGGALLAVGGALFVISDSLLALNKFLPAELFQIPNNGFWVMLSYLLAQLLICLGIIKNFRSAMSTGVKNPEALG